MDDYSVAVKTFIVKKEKTFTDGRIDLFLAKKYFINTYTEIL